jgi:hypothetical protein
MSERDKGFSSPSTSRSKWREVFAMHHTQKRVTEDKCIRYTRRSLFFLHLLTYQSQNAARRDYSLLCILFFGPTQPLHRLFRATGGVQANHHLSTSRFKLREVCKPTTTSPPPVSSNGRFSSPPPAAHHSNRATVVFLHLPQPLYSPWPPKTPFWYFFLK